MTADNKHDHWELLLFFERFDFSAGVAYEKLKKQGYKPATVYRWKQKHREADLAVKQIQKEL